MEDKENNDKVAEGISILMDMCDTVEIHCEITWRYVEYNYPVKTIKIKIGGKTFKGRGDDCRVQTLRHAIVWMANNFASLGKYKRLIEEALVDSEEIIGLA